MVVHIQARLHLIQLGFTHWAPSYSLPFFPSSPYCPHSAFVGPEVVLTHKKAQVQTEWFNLCTQLPCTFILGLVSMH